MSNTFEEAQARMMEIYEEQQVLTKKKLELQRLDPPEEVQDYALKTTDGSEVRLADLFGDKSDLLLIHNMGKSCPYCTLWADGFIGVKDHIENRTAFVLVSPDEPAVQKEFVEGRGWNFRTLSSAGSSFTKDMGFEDDEGRYMPGFSTFRKDEDGSIKRISFDYFGPGDSYSAIWHFMDHLDSGADGWQPLFSY